MSIKILRAEHSVTLKMLEKAELAKEKMEKGFFPPADLFIKIVEFTDGFVDRFHHFKEEYIIFGVLAEKKKGDIDSGIGALRFHHERVKKCVREIESSLFPYKKGDEIAAANILTNLSSIISLLKRHIYLEETFYIPLCLEVFTDEDKDALKEEFEENLLNHKEVFRKNLKLIDEMGELLN